MQNVLESQEVSFTHNQCVSRSSVNGKELQDGPGDFRPMPGSIVIQLTDGELGFCNATRNNLLSDP